MRDIKPEWIAALRAVTGCETDTIRANHFLHRYEFLLRDGDNVTRSQFWGQYYRVAADGTRIPLQPDPVTGLFPYRELNDDAMREALDNLRSTYVGNPWSGAGSPRREILRRMAHNRAAGQAHYRKLGEEWADRFLDRTRRMRGEPLIPVGVDLKRSA